MSAAQPQSVLGHPGRGLPASALVGLAVAVMATLVVSAVKAQPQITPSAVLSSDIALPQASTQGRLSFEAALARRRSLRTYAATPLTVAEVSQLLWAAQGITGEKGLRTAPSAGATYPLALYLVATHIERVPNGLYRYLPQGHRLSVVASGDMGAAVATAALGQTWMQAAPALVLIAAQQARTAARYGARADRYVAIEAGAAAQNLVVQAVTLGLGGTVVGAMDEAVLRRVVLPPAGEQVIMIVPVGRPR